MYQRSNTEQRCADGSELGGYRLTEGGAQLLARLDGMEDWTQQWGRRLERRTAEPS